MTADGKITTRQFGAVDFTSREDKQHLWRQRASADAVMVGYGTLRRDNVRLALPAELRDERVRSGKSPAPVRVIVSNRGKIDTRLKLFESRVSPIAIFSTSRMPENVRRALKGHAAVHLTQKDQVDLLDVLRTLQREYGVKRVACEGGPTLFRGMLEMHLIDELNLTIAPFLFGGAAAPTLIGLTRDFLPESVRCRLTKMRVVGNECFLTYRIKT
jgi:riboflavin-specific deaminase-like protein